jgi:DNA polymerase-3 subunit gamma/tau
MELLIEVENNLRLVNYQIGRIEFQPTDAAAANLSSRFTKFLKTQTGSRWVVSVVSSGGRKTIREERLEKNLMFENESMVNPIVREIFKNFPDSKIEKIHEAKKNKESVLRKQFEINAKDQEWDPVEEE